MLFSQKQIEELLKVIEKNTNIFIAKHIGSEYLTQDEKKSLESIGINPNKLYSLESDLVTQSFNFGILSDAIGNIDSKKLTFDNLLDYFKHQKHIPLSEIDKATIESIKHQSLSDIRANKGRIFNDVNNVISKVDKNNRVAYEKIIRDRILEGTLKKESVGTISRELGILTGDWSRNFTKSIEFISHLALSEGRLSIIEKQNPNSKIWMSVYDKACPSCIKLYLTKGIGSEPKLFTINELKNAGSNIGRKVSEWKPVIPPCHVYCRCMINKFQIGSQWDPKLKRFELIKQEKPNRPLIHFSVKIGSEQKEYYV